MSWKQDFFFFFMSVGESSNHHVGLESCVHDRLTAVSFIKHLNLPALTVQIRCLMEADLQKKDYQVEFTYPELFGSLPLLF